MDSRCCASAASGFWRRILSYIETAPTRFPLRCMATALISSLRMHSPSIAGGAGFTFVRREKRETTERISFINIC